MRSTPKVLVSRRWPEAVQNRLSHNYEVEFNEQDKPLTASQFAQALTQYDAILPTVTDNLSGEALSPAGPLRTQFIGNYGVGYSHIDEVAARDLGLVVTNTPDVLSECTADIAMTLLLSVARRAGEGEREVRDMKWSGWRPTHLIGTKVSGATLGIVGFGRIGQEMARRAHHGFGMKVLVQNRSPVDPVLLRGFGATQVPTLDALLPQCDFVSLHCPGGEGNRHLIDAKRLRLMRQDAFLINTARGEVVDDEALCRAVSNGVIAGAGLDVFEGEPTLNPCLYHTPNLVLLPHLGSATRATREAMGFRVIDNLDAFFAGGQPHDRVI